MSAIYGAASLFGFGDIHQLRPMSTSPSLTITSLLKRNVRPVLLLGAGCSVRSGVPTADTLVGQIAKWGYCVSHAKTLDDPTVVRTDWLPWLEKQAWYRHEQPLADQYPMAVEAVLRPQQSRKDFFRKILNPGLPASRGYQVLTQLLARKLVSTVLTTNFDQLIAQECRSTAAVHLIEEIRTPGDLHLISTSPEYPQIIYLHGSVEHYADKNIEEETKRLNQTLVENLFPILRDHPLVVIGYRGAEASIMQHLLIDQIERCASFRRGIYWCHRGVETPSERAPLLGQLAASLGSNFSYVPIDGFDELMIEISTHMPELLANTAAVVPRATVDLGVMDVNDLKPSTLTMAQLDGPLLRSKIIAYCSAVRLPTPTIATEEELWAAMGERNLAVRRTNLWAPTEGGRLLFARSSAEQSIGASVEVNLMGDAEWLTSVLQRSSSSSQTVTSEQVRIDGNLWAQLENLLTLFARVNRPFRLKGHASREVYPYPPLALKEIATNLLAHRDYDFAGPARITITPEKIVCENPGGLTDHVRRQLQDREMQAVIQASARGIKGYRNPVIADFFFSAGAMDKEGSGLPDVVAEASNNVNALAFGPTADNSTFRVEISVRPEALNVDPKTRTSRAIQREVRFSPNLLPVISWPEQIWRIPATVPRGETRNLREAGAPPFFMHEDAIWTFVSPAIEDASAFLHFASKSAKPSSHATESILTSEFARGSLPWLLNTALERHVDGIGVAHRFMANSIRAYFESNGTNPRTVSYRGLFKQATRTVVKPLLSRTTNTALFWEHKAVALRFEQFGCAWALALLPTYVFTKTGTGEWIDSQRIGPRTTKRTARDYNPTVLHNLVFWSRVLSGGSEGAFSVSLGAAGPATDTAPRIDLAGLVPIATFDKQQDSPFSSTVVAALDALTAEDVETADDEAAAYVAEEADEDD